jgi:TPP-dependent pyruvate/acetoin dehydrogenase alpha subunit
MLMRPDEQLLRSMYHTMRRIRRFEETAEELYKHDVISGILHLCIGMEAVATGACLALQEHDYITSTHRGHGHLIAKGADTSRLLAELCGRVTGYCRGKGGSMHAADLSLGVLGANGIVGGGIGIATGAALSSQRRNSGQVTVCFFGDGAANQGILMEAMNMAALWRLPVLYLCEHNTFAEYTRSVDVTADRPLRERAAALGLHTWSVDGDDVLAIHGVMKEAASLARSGDGPSFVEAHTYRFSGHHVGDVGFGRGYRTAEELEERRQREPIYRFRTVLTQDLGFAEEVLASIDEEVELEMQVAVEFAKASPMPDLSTLMEDVYA